MIKLFFAALIIVNLAVIGLCVHTRLSIRGIRSDFETLTFRLHGPLDESAWESPRTLEEASMYHNRIIAARWEVVRQSANRLSDLDRAAGIYTLIGALFVSLSFFSCFLITRLND